MKSLRIQSPGESCTSELGSQIAKRLVAGDILAMWGDLGAGKTFLARSIARALGVPPSIPVTSPTFTFINEYRGVIPIYHLDLYRLADPDEIDTLPWREALYGTGVAMIEWPERLGRQLPEERFDIQLTIVAEESRSVEIGAQGAALRQRLERWIEEMAEPLAQAGCILAC